MRPFFFFFREANSPCRVPPQGDEESLFQSLFIRTGSFVSIRVWVRAARRWRMEEAEMGSRWGFGRQKWRESPPTGGYCTHTILSTHSVSTQWVNQSKEKKNTNFLIFELCKHKQTNTHTYFLLCVSCMYPNKCLCRRPMWTYIGPICMGDCMSLATHCKASFYRCALFLSSLIMREKGQCLVSGEERWALHQDPWFLYLPLSSPIPANEHVQQAKGAFTANLIHFSRQLWNLPLTLVITPRLTKRWSQLINDP